MTRHDLDRTALFFGLLFVAIAAIFAVDQAADVDIDASTVGALALLLVGAIGLAIAVRRGLGRTNRPVATDAATDQGPRGDGSPPTSTIPDTNESTTSEHGSSDPAEGTFGSVG